MSWVAEGFNAIRYSYNEARLVAKQIIGDCNNHNDMSLTGYAKMSPNLLSVYRSLGSKSTR